MVSWRLVNKGDNCDHELGLLCSTFPDWHLNIMVECFKHDDFGHVIGTIYKDSVGINQMMLDAGHAVPYMS